MAVESNNSVVCPMPCQVVEYPIGVELHCERLEHPMSHRDISLPACAELGRCGIVLLADGEI